MDNWISNQRDPFEIFNEWYEEGIQNVSFEPAKVTLATVDESGMPAARVVLLKRWDEKGFCFFTNYESPKSKELLSAGKAALVFHWEKPFHRQVRINGLVEKMTYEESDDYFQSRERGSQIGAWASPQSQKIASRSELENRVQEIAARFPEGARIPCPEHWGGFRICPLKYEFWQAGSHRLHDRMMFLRENLDSGWSVDRLAP